jgi:hypothetical protein
VDSCGSDGMPAFVRHLWLASSHLTSATSYLQPQIMAGAMCIRTPQPGGCPSVSALDRAFNIQPI